MVSLDVGRVCLKIVGREAGKVCAVVKKLKEGKSEAFVLVTGPKLLSGVKRRKCNVEHLEPTQYLLSIKEDASDEEVLEAYKKSGVISKFNLKLPSAAEVKSEKTKPKEEKKEKPKEEKKAKEEKKKDSKKK
jgi:large subunit ribosomal protein L14e